MSDLEARLAEVAGEDEWTRHRALDQLRGQRHPAPDIERLAERFADEDATARAAARMALAALASPDSASTDNALRVLVEGLGSTHENIRVLSASALGEAGNSQAGPDLVEALDDPSPNVAAAAADALGELRYGGALEQLAELARGADFWVRAAAIVALGRLEDERAVDVLGELAREPGLERPIVEALQRINHPAALPALERVHGTAPGDALHAAGRILAAFPDTNAPAWVVESARHRQEELRYELIQEDDPAVARLVGLSGSAESVQCLIDLLGPPRRSEAAITGVLATPPAERSDVLLARLPHADPRERVTLLALLPPLIDRDRIKKLVPFLSEDHESVRGAAAEALARAHPREALPILTAEMDRERVAPEVIRALGSLGEVACASLVPLLADRSAKVRAAAANALARCPNAGVERDLRGALGGEEDPDAKAAILRALARGAGSSALDVLGEALGSDRMDMRLAAIEGLGFTGDPGAVPLLEKMLGSSQVEALGALRSLGQLERPEAAAVIVPYLTSPDIELRRAAAREAEGLANDLEPDAVERLAKDPDAQVRRRAVGVLAARGGEDRERLRELAEQDPDPDVRSAARGKLARSD